MKLNYIIGLFFVSLLLFSCKDDSENNIRGNEDYFDAQIYSFSMAASHKKEGDSLSRAEDSLRFIVLGKTKFAIDQVNGRIYNPDSLPYGIKLENVKLTLSYNSNYGLNSIKIENPDSIYDWNNTDSVNFSKRPIKINTEAPSGAKKEYKIDLLIHKIDTDIFVWQNQNTIPYAVEAQKVLLVNNEFYSYTTNTGIPKLYKASKNSVFSWSDITLTGLPSNVVLNSITYLNGLYFAISSDGKSFTSSDGATWSVQNNGANVAAIYGVLQGSSVAADVLLVVLNNGSDYSFATTTDLQNLKVETVSGGVTIKDLPVSGFASTTNSVRNANSNILVITAGYNNTSETLSNTLLIKQSAKGIEITQSIKNSLFSGGGNSSFYYTKNYLYTIAENEIYISNSWGERWFLAPYKQVIASEIPVRTHQSIIVDEDNYIWIFGGKSASGSYLSDVWKGRLNGFE